LVFFVVAFPSLPLLLVLNVTSLLVIPIPKVLVFHISLASSSTQLL
jgi:hypothetical protein